MRAPQRAGERGSLKWIQHVVNARPEVLDGPVLASIKGARSVKWLSPLHGDDFAEYRDGDFLGLLGLPELKKDLQEFWPRGGPQWDALARTNSGQVVLVEAKSHIREILGGATQAGEATRPRIEAALDATAAALGARPRAPWSTTFFQLANRLAHLNFLRARGVDAKLLLVGFVGDADMNGPDTEAEWRAAYVVAHHVMGLSERHPLARHILHVHPDVRRLGQTAESKRPGAACPGPCHFVSQRLIRRRLFRL